MLIKLVEPIVFGENRNGSFLTWWILVENGRVYASNKKRARYDLLGRVA